MPALNYKARFAPLVRSGRKRQTIRALRKDGRDPKPGDTLYHYTGMRTKASRKLSEAVCQSAVPIHMTCGMMAMESVEVDGKWLVHHELDWLARADGRSAEAVQSPARATHRAANAMERNAGADHTTERRRQRKAKHGAGRVRRCAGRAKHSTERRRRSADRRGAGKAKPSDGEAGHRAGNARRSSGYGRGSAGAALNGTGNAQHSTAKWSIAWRRRGTPFWSKKPGRGRAAKNILRILLTSGKVSGLRRSWTKALRAWEQENPARISDSCSENNRRASHPHPAPPALLVTARDFFAVASSLYRDRRRRQQPGPRLR